MATHTINSSSPKRQTPRFQQALKRLNEDFGNWKIASLTRVEQDQNGVKVPVCVITVEL